MKRLMLFFSLLMLSMVLAACGGDNNNDTPSGDRPDDDTTTEENQEAETDDQKGDQSQGDQEENVDSDDMKQKMDELDYTDFELEVDYGKDQEYEAEIEQENEGIKADLEDEINGEDLNGQEAFDKIYPLVEQLTIDKETPKEDAIAEILDVFDLEDDYEKFEVEITFSDGVKVEFEDRK